MEKEILDVDSRDEAEKLLAEIFDVNPIVVKIDWMWFSRKEIAANCVFNYLDLIIDFFLPLL